MSDNRLSQSPRALRESTNDPEKWSKGEVETTMKEPGKSGSPENEGAWKLYGEKYEPRY